MAAVAAGAGVAWEALDLLAAIGASAAVPALTALADQDDRIPPGGTEEYAWADDRLRRRIREVIG